MRRNRVLLLVAEPLLGAVGFLTAYALNDQLGFNPLPFENYTASMAVSIAAFWFAALLTQNSLEENNWKLFQELLFISLGLNLLAQSLLAYISATLLLENLPFLVLIAGILISSVLLTVVWRWLLPRRVVQQAGILLVGFDTVAAQVINALQRPVLGIIDTEPATVPAGIAYLGGIAALDTTVASRRPARIIVSDALVGKGPETNLASPGLLLRLLEQRVRGIIVEPAAAAYERLFDRTSISSLQPLDFFSSSRLLTDRSTLALQSIYNNLIGLVLLVCMLPVIFLLSVAIRLFCGPGPGIEAVECTGFQNIPFHMLRFRTLRFDGEGNQKLSRLGKFLLSWHLVSLPQLINLVRGEMALFGPRPVRVEYAERLCSLVPFYSHRFSVKPGIMSWAQIKLHDNPVIPDDLLRFEYDLFYIRQSSPMLDLEIFFLALFGRRQRKAATHERPAAHEMMEQPRE